MAGNQVGRRGPLDDVKVPVRLKLSALWAATMFCYVYGDFFGLFRVGRLAKMNAGMMGPLGEATPGTLVAVSAMMAIPSMMVILSLVLPAAVARWMNVALGVAYSAIMVLTMLGAPPFYQLFGVIEVVLTMSIMLVALRWPRVPQGG